ncbi:DUF3560 domain-containing protein [Xenorhabdus bovienii]|uniref:DUF3560 domain-containing protein n=1 Tax=Xenorhabdus bovienii TaxID=40576 RepID=UPI0023B2890A|nr:DUF3560 domain-containing protein [Xenorhabdus bovienii]MDE9544185.1 DUF3560 domain-containing protein [Xenorhabdus bovienii]
MTKHELAIEALNRAENNHSETNYDAIFAGFMDMGIREEDIEPRVNVFTFRAWKAKDRVVKKGEKGVKVITYILVDKKEENLEETKKVKVKRQTTVFHISQTKPLDAPTEPEDIPLEAQDVNLESQEKPLNWYEEKQARRKERYQELAENAAIQSNGIYSRAKEMASVIPFGQPILIGHHSEKRDRNYRQKITNTFDKSFEQAKKSKYYENKADSVGKSGISSDDPDAIVKLQDKLARLQKSHEIMKSVNKIVKNKKLIDEQKIINIAELGLKKETAEELLKGDFIGRIGFASYQLQNNNAEINRIKKRIESLSKNKDKTDVIEVNENFIFKLDYEINRIMFIFEGKPSDDIREILKGNAFNWSKTNKAWIRKTTPNALYAAKSVKAQLSSL